MNKAIRFLDVGAADFQDERWMNIKDRVHYIGVEPDSRSSSGDSGAFASREWVNSLLAGQSGQRTFYLTKKPQVSSMLKPNNVVVGRFPDNDRFSLEKIVELETVCIDSLGVKPDFIKLDVQGGELEILNGAENTLRSVLGLETECYFLDFYKDQPLFSDLLDYLRSKEFEFFDFTSAYRFARDGYYNSGQLVFSDALFLRTPEWVSKNCDQMQTVKYCLICAIYKRFDLIDRFIGQLDEPDRKFIEVKKRKHIWGLKLVFWSRKVLKFLTGETDYGFY